MSKFVTLHGFGNSYGTELNFKIVNGLTQPTTNLIENTIWVQTEEEVSNYIFSSFEPTNPKPNTLWIFEQENENISNFNVLKGDAIYVYPLSAKLYLNNEWVKQEASFYQNGIWRKIGPLSLYENGVFNTEVFGTPYLKNVTTQADGSLLVGRYGEINTTIAVDATPYSIFKFDIVRDNSGRADVTIVNATDTAGLAKIYQVSAVGTYTCDISGINEPILIKFYIYGNQNSDTTYLNNLQLVP